MSFVSEFKQKIFEINDKNFETEALKVFRFQAENCNIYNQYLRNLGIDPNNVRNLSNIPFLPIEFFKQFDIKSTKSDPEKFFLSSGTTGTRSKHLVFDLSFYKSISIRIFESFFGSLQNRLIVSYLPNYLENPHSSLIQMMQWFMDRSGHPDSGFYEKGDLEEVIRQNKKHKVLLFGVTFALLDLSFSEHYPHLMVMDTGGMKGREREMVRAEVATILEKNLQVDHVYSEYGMTELLSQCYTNDKGYFRTPPWMKVILRDVNDPFDYSKVRGAINIIDLANIETCSFIETKDLGRYGVGGMFEVLGRMDNSDLRGCSLMVV